MTDVFLFGKFFTWLFMAPNIPSLSGICGLQVHSFVFGEDVYSPCWGEVFVIICRKGSCLTCWALNGVRKSLSTSIKHIESMEKTGKRLVVGLNLNYGLQVNSWRKIFHLNFSKQQYPSFLVAVILFSKSVAYKPTMTCLVSDMNCNLLPWVLKTFQFNTNVIIIEWSLRWELYCEIDPLKWWRLFTLWIEWVWFCL